MTTRRLEHPAGGGWLLDARPTGRRTWRDTVRLLVPALVVYAAIRALGLVTLAAMAVAYHQHLGTALSSWDGLWYLHIAQHGYTGPPIGPLTHGRLPYNDVAFFPLYPALLAVLSDTGIAPVTAGVTLSLAAGLVAAAGIAKVGEEIAGRRAGVMLVALWAALPHAVVESMTYTESLFTAFAAWALWAVLRRRWVTAGALTALGGLTRPTATALIAAVGLAAALAAAHPGPRHERARALYGLLLAPVGFVAFVGWAGLHLGRLDGWYYVQSHAWHSRLDLAYTPATILYHLTHASPFGFQVITVVLLVAPLLLVLSVTQRIPWPLLVYSVAGYLLDAANGGLYTAKARLLIPVFTLLIPLATTLARRRSAAFVVTAMATFSAWYGSYLLLLWHHSP